MVDCLVFSICYFRLRKKMKFTNLSLNKEMNDGGNGR